MSPSEVQALVNSQLKQWAPSELAELRDCILEPKVIECLDPVRNGSAKLWLVFTELPGKSEGYGIAYDEESNEFGLIEFRSDMLPVLVGLHGSFSNAVEAM